MEKSRGLELVVRVVLLLLPVMVEALEAVLEVLLAQKPES